MLASLGNLLERRPLACLTVLAVVATLVITSGGIASLDAMPFGDGEHYILRALALYGFLHSGAWTSFWNELNLPSQSLLPPGYLAFFLVPSSLATVPVYGVLQTLVSCLLLGIGAYALCTALERPAWSVPLFLLCTAQNMTLHASYFYFVDTPFMAMAMLSFALQLRAWRKPGATSSLLAGLGVSLPFWTKPANALVFLGLFVLAELLYLTLRHLRAREAWAALLPGFIRHGLLVLAGFLPLFLGAMACGGFQSIVYLIAANGVSSLFVTKVTSTGLYRLLYFPLCLTFFYNAVIFALIFSITLIIGWTRRPQKPASPVPFAVNALLAQVLACVIFGLYFSFGMMDKELRALVIVLPVLWLGALRLIECRGIAPRFVTVGALIYATCASLQVTSGIFGDPDMPYSNADPFESETWLNQFPTRHLINEPGIHMTRGLNNIIHRYVPDGGVIAIGTEMMFVTAESLNWVEQQEDALAGKTSPYQYNNFISNTGELSRPALRNARVILLIVSPKLQYSREVALATVAMARLTCEDWDTKQQIAKVAPLRDGNNDVMGLLVILKEPLTDAQFDQLLTAVGNPEMKDSLIFTSSKRRHLSWPECREIIWQWLSGKRGNVTDPR
jgi:uncharacterized protein (DUF697 family)